MDLMLPLKKAGLRCVSAGVDAALALLPPRVRAIVADRAPMTRPLDYGAVRILVHVDSELEYRVRLGSAAKEPETVAWLESMRDGDVLYDIGANIGAYSLIAAKRYDGRVRVCAFEPSAMNYGQLVRNLALNSCGDTVTPIPVALGATTHATVFNYQNVTRGGALHALGTAVDDQGRPFIPVLRQRVRVQTLDEVVEQYELPPPTHMKIDVDGGEVDILAGASRTLASPSLRGVLVEASTTQDAAARVGEVMRQAGFLVASRHAQGPGGANFIFERKDPRAGEARR